MEYNVVVLPLPVGPVVRKSPCGFSTNLVSSVERFSSRPNSIGLSSLVFFSSNLGNASSHSTRNLPIVLAGGGFRHGQHLAFDRKNNAPFSNVFVAIARRMGIEVETFGTSNGTGLKGLEMVG